MTDEYQSAGDFSIEEATLILSGGDELDISGVIVEIEFFESIDSPAISGIVSFVNTDGLSNLGPIIGQEFLKLKIKTPSYDEKDTFDFTKNVLHVTNVTSGQVGNNGEILFLHVITSEIVKNEKTIVSRSVEGTYSDFVKQLLEYDLECKKPLDIQETSGIRRYILPRSKPFDLIKNFRRKAVSADNAQSPSPTFVFFENFRGYHFKTLEKLYTQEPVMTYFESSTGVTTKDNGMGIDGPAMTNKLTRELSTIKTSVVVNDKDTLKNISRGALSSELNTFDLVTKQFNGGKGPTSPFKYNYFEDRKNEKHINNVSTIDGNKIPDNPIYSDVTSYGQRISDKTSVHFLSFTATDPDSGGDALHSAESSGGLDANGTRLTGVDNRSLREKRHEQHAQPASAKNPEQDKINRGRLVTITTKSGAKFSVAKKYENNFRGFFEDLENTGYNIKPGGGSGGYNYRKAKASGRFSYHASGLAIDINPSANPFGKRLITDMPSNIAQIASRHGLGWGGDWNSVKDAMHFCIAKHERGNYSHPADGVVPV